MGLSVFGRSPLVQASMNLRIQLNVASVLAAKGATALPSTRPIKVCCLNSNRAIFISGLRCFGESDSILAQLAWTIHALSLHTIWVSSPKRTFAAGDLAD
jgi:hypothetical protein